MEKFFEESGKLFDSGYYCAESVLISVTKAKGIENDLIPAIATGFCGGVSRTAGMCGAVSGAIMALNIIYGRKNQNIDAALSYLMVNKFIKKFKEEYGSINCKELTGYDLGIPEEHDMFVKENKLVKCREVTCRAAAIALELINE